jgi:hypothetical protein
MDEKEDEVRQKDMSYPANKSLIKRRQQKDKKDDGDEYQAQLEQLGTQIESVQDFWRYNNNTPVDQIKMRESIYLFKQGFKPIWEDRRNINGGSWTFRVPKSIGPDVWTRVQLLAIGEKFESCLDQGTLPQCLVPLTSKLVRALA